MLFATNRIGKLVGQSTEHKFTSIVDILVVSKRLYKWCPNANIRNLSYRSTLSVIIFPYNK